MKNKKQFTLIELIIVIVVVGILAAMAMPKFNGVVRGAKLAAMINDKEVLEKTLILYYQKNDELPLLNEDQELIVQNKGISLSKIVLAEEAQNGDMDTIYKSLKETLTYYNDSEETLYRIDLSKIKDNLGKDIKYGHKKHDKDFYVYSTKTGNVYYYDYLVNGNGTIQHTEYDTLLKDNELIAKTISPSLNGGETIINNKPIIELTTNLEDITIDTIIKWEYVFTDEDAEPTEISFILNDTEYDSFDKIPTKLNSGDYTIKLKMQDSKGLWGNEVVKNFIVENNVSIQDKNTFSKGSHTLHIGKDGNLYVWGSNSYNQLGIENVDYIATPRLLTLPNGEKPISIGVGFTHSMVITNKGNLYGWGGNSAGELGLGVTPPQLTPQKLSVPNGEKPVSISLGYYYSLIITDNGNMYAAGNNNYGQLGVGDTNFHLTFTKVLLPNGEKPISIESSNSHSMIITDKGNLYSWGRNVFGVLGTKNTIDQSIPQKVTLPNGEKPVSISLGSYCSMVITDKRNLYVWGNNNRGQLGIGNKIDQLSPIKATLPNDEKPVSVSSKGSSSFIITNKGNLYATGSNVFGELGLGHTENEQEFKLVTLPNGEKPISIVSGENQSMVTTINGTKYAWGYNRFGNLGIGNTTNQLSPTKIILP